MTIEDTSYSGVRVNEIARIIQVDLVWRGAARCSKENRMSPPRESAAIPGTPLEAAWILKIRPLRQARILGEIVFIPLIVLVVACANHHCPRFIASMNPQAFAFCLALCFSSFTMSAVCEIKLFLNRKCPRCRRDFFNLWGPFGEWRRRCRFCALTLYPEV